MDLEGLQIRVQNNSQGQKWESTRFFFPSPKTKCASGYIF